MAEVIKDKAYYKNSGGECMLQIDFLLELLKKRKEKGIHTAVDTAGHVPFERFEQILPYTALFLYDIKTADPGLHRQYTGVGNERILENLKKLICRGAKIWIRIPVIPQVNDSVEEMERIKGLLVSFGTPEKVELLPYHAMGEHKYPALGRLPQCFRPPGKEQMDRLKACFGGLPL